MNPRGERGQVGRFGVGGRNLAVQLVAAALVGEVSGGRSVSGLTLRPAGELALHALRRS